MIKWAARPQKNSAAPKLKDPFKRQVRSPLVSFNTSRNLVFYLIGRNIYDVSKPCEGEISETLCYPITKYFMMKLKSTKNLFHILYYRIIAGFLNKPDTRELLGVDESVTNYTGCSPQVMTAFVSHQDRFSQMAQFYVAEVLERGIDVLIYVGTYDMICNWVCLLS